MQVVVVIPTFNEAGSIVSVCEAVRVSVPTASILVIDDSSTDATVNLATSVGDRLGSIEVFERPAKLGIGSAYRDGFRIAIERGAEVIVQIDGDLSHDPAALDALIANVANGADLAIGSRYVPGGRTINWPRRRLALSRWGNRYAAGMLGLAVNDATAGMRAYAVDALHRMDYESVTAEGYGFQIEMTHRLVRVEGSIVEFPITFTERSEGESKMSGGIVREALVLVLRLWVSDRRGRRQRRRDGG